VRLNCILGGFGRRCGIKVQPFVTHPKVITTPNQFWCLISSCCNFWGYLKLRPRSTTLVKGTHLTIISNKAIFLLHFDKVVESRFARHPSLLDHFPNNTASFFCMLFYTLLQFSNAAYCTVVFPFH
jgi:hypothetical protein